MSYFLEKVFFRILADYDCNIHSYKLCHLVLFLHKNVKDVWALTNEKSVFKCVQNMQIQIISSDYFSLQKHVYSNIMKISPPKTESFQIKIMIFFIFLLKT